jgi:7,8-dihydroneopterin aldolase/epimerase/oxygenase
MTGPLSPHAEGRDADGDARLDRLSVRGLRAFGYHGVLAAERRAGQEFVADVTLGLDTRLSAAQDDLSATVDYASLTNRLGAAISSDPVDLIETLASRLAELCLAEPQVVWVEVTIHKPAAPLEVLVDDVSITIHRSRND